MDVRTNIYPSVYCKYDVPDSTKLLCILSSNIQAYSLAHSGASPVASYFLIGIENRQLTIAINRMAGFLEQLGKMRGVDVNQEN